MHTRAGLAGAGGPAGVPGGRNTKRTSVFASSLSNLSERRVSAGKKEKKDKWQCRGLRRWSQERCERESKVEPPRWPYVGYYCPLHTYQQVDLTGHIERQYQHFLETRVPSYKAEEEAVAESKKASAAEHADLVKLLREKKVVRTHKAMGRAYANSFTGAAFLRFLCASRGIAAIEAVGMAQSLLESGLLVAITGDMDGRFAMDSSLYRLASDADPALERRVLVERLEDASLCATVRIAVVKARQLGVYGKKSSSPFVKVQYRDHGALSAKSAILKIGRTGVEFNTLEPRWAEGHNPDAPRGAPRKLLSYQLTDKSSANDGRPDATVAHARLITWSRPGTGKEPNRKRWTPTDEREPDSNTFEFRVPKPTVIYKDRHEVLSWAAAAGDIQLSMYHVKNDSGSSTNFMGEVTVPIASLLVPKAGGMQLAAEEQSLMWYRLEERSEEARTADDDNVAGHLMLRVSLRLDANVHKHGKKKRKGPR